MKAYCWEIIGEKLLTSIYGRRITFDVDDLHPKSVAENYRSFTVSNYQRIITFGVNICVDKLI
jgi:hypothetical protein